MDINSDEEPSPVFKLFTPQTVSQEKGKINEKTENAKTLPTSQLNNTDFDDCSQLPDGLKNLVSSELIGIPLDDPFYGNNETFIVINKKKQLFRFSSTNALGMFSPTSAIRSMAIRIVTHPFYAKFMVLVILAFCWINALNATDDHFDARYFLIIFLLEFFLKIISYGLVLSPFSYLRNGWNILDVVLNILLCGTTVLAELRVLKIISYSLNARKTIRLYWSSVKSLRALIIYMALMLAILSTMFLQIYMGTLTQACVDDVTFKLDENKDIRYCGNSTGAQTCPESYVCLQGAGHNPDFGYTSYDSIFPSILSTFRLTTRDFWENILHLVLATSGPWHILSFIGIIFIISYQVLSLIWGQIAISYNYIRLQRWEQNLISEDINIDDVLSQESKNNKDAGCWSKFQRFFFFIIYDPYAVLFVIICIILNTLCMALDHHDMAIELDKVLRVANYIFVLVFVVEAIFKLLALGIVRYFKDEWNTFDFFVTVIGAVELVLEGVQGLSVFRSFRLLRPLRLGKIVPAFDLILTRMQHLLSVVSGQTILFFMAIYLFTVFGWQLFGPESFNYSKYIANEIELPMWRFEDLMHSFMIVFRALCGEWIETMFVCMLLSRYHVICIIYYLLLVSVSSFQVMHIFTALLFTNDDSTAISTKNTQEPLQQNAKPKEKFQLGQFLKEKLLEPSIKRIYDEYRPKKDIESIGETPSAKVVSKAEIEADFVEAINNKDTSIPIEPPTTTDSQEIVVKNKYFQHCVTLCVLAASFALAVEYDNSTRSYEVLEIILVYVEYLFIGLLSYELMTKLISRGWKLCVTDIWYWVDLFNIIISVLGIFLQFEALAILTCLRPLSLVQRCRPLNIIATALLKQMWFLSNTLLVCLAFWLIFAIMGVQLFGGKFFSCVDSNFTSVETIDSRAECLDANLTWINSFMNFDDVIQSYYSLFEVSTFKGWLAIINGAVNSRYVDEQPIKEVNIYMFFYFVIFIACGVFVCVNVIVGMLVQHMIHFGSLSALFDQTKRNSGKSNETPDKNETLDENRSSSKLINFVRSRVFEKIAFASYVLYVIILMNDHYQMSIEFNDALQWVHLVLLVLLIIEVILRVYAYRKEYFVSSWNRFDLVIVVFTIIEFVFMELVVKYVISISLFRVVRIFRFNALIASSSKTLQRCGKIITKTWKTVSMLYVFLYFIIYIYALIGMVLYEDTKIVLSSVDILNFQTFRQSFVLLIQMSTGAGWDGVLEQISEEHPFVAAIYLLSFLYISFTILLNVMLVIAYEFYKEVTSIEDDRKQLQASELNDFNEKWNQFAQNDHNYVPKNRLKDFFNALDETSSLRPAEYDEKEFTLLGVNTRKDDNYSRSALLITLNRIRLNKQQS